MASGQVVFIKDPLGARKRWPIEPALAFGFCSTEPPGPPGPMDVYGIDTDRNDGSRSNVGAAIEPIVAQEFAAY